MEETPSIIQQTDAEFAANQQTVEVAFGRVKKSKTDYLALAIATCGVGYIKLAPGTWGSLVGVGLFLLLQLFELAVWNAGINVGWRENQLEAWRIPLNALIVLLISAIGIWAAGRTADILKSKDPQIVVVDEIAGQFIALMFIPLNVSWWMIAAGFVLFRFFDILKPYPINGMQELPGGFGVVVDDLVAGIYAAIVMSIIAAIQLSFT